MSKKRIERLDEKQKQIEEDEIRSIEEGEMEAYFREQERIFYRKNRSSPARSGAC